MAWALAKKRDSSAQERSEALEHAQAAVTKSPNDSNYRTTLALADYRAGHWAESIAAAERSITLKKGVDASNWFFLAMARSQKSDKEEARKRFDKAVEWAKQDPKNVELRQFWSEAAQLLGVPGPA